MTTFKRLLPLVSLLLFLIPSASASAAAPAAPGWTLDSIAEPTNFSASSGYNEYQVTATNAGSVSTDGTPVVLTDALPEGVTVQRPELLLVENVNTINGDGIPGGTTIPVGSACSTTARSVRCTTDPGVVVAPDDWLLMNVYVTLNSGASGALQPNLVTVSGGGAPLVSSESSGAIDPALAPFGPSNFEFYKDASNGTQEAQAGGHPYELTTTIDLDNKLGPFPGGMPGPGRDFPASVEDVKDIVVDLPLGFAGSTLAAPQCTEEQLDSTNHCPPDTVVGHLTTEPLTDATINGPIWNIAPEYGHPAEFGYIDALKGAHIAGYVSVVPTPAGYVLRFTAPDIPEVLLSRIVVTFYGDPAQRDGTGTVPQVPFFTNPTACSNGPQEATVWMDSWAHPASFQSGSGGLIPTNLTEPEWKQMRSLSPPVTGCNALSFTPEIGSQPTTREADKPTGLEFEQRLPQSETFGSNATPALKDTTIVFPEGMTVDPSAADGLGTCSDAQIGWQGHAPAQPGELYDFSEAKPECPESSKIGTLELETPLIPGKLYGEVFLAAQNENPFDSTFATYIVVNDPVTGVVLKLAGELKANPSTGRLTAVFDETPQLPFSALKVHFFGGPRAELATPPGCGVYTTTSELAPWSIEAGQLAATPFDSYTIDENCATGFNPAFTGGSTNLQAGAYTTFQASFERQDSDQELAGAKIELPPGMLANLPSVTECGAAELAAEVADAPTGGCPASSKVGTVEAGAGPGPNPLFVPGQVFFTGPYNGGPFGLAVVVSANPGPFHFGNVVVRQSLRIDPQTSAVTDVSDPFPTYLDPVAPNGQTTGIPIKLRRVDVEINRPGFTFNSANCAKEAFEVGGDITSVSAQSKTLATPFQVTNCKILKYEPKLTVTTSAHTSKADGASLHFDIAYPKTAQIGNEAWFKTMKFTIPKQLPARLTTIQKACVAKVFEANPAACPKESVIGQAVVHTPILPTTLSGPLYFVSYGNQKFPEAVLVLQGDGVELIVHGETFISHSGVTSATFKTVPEAPFESVEVNVPTGPFSEFAANGDLCTDKLKMPIEFTSSDGALIKEETPIGVSGCKPAIYVTKHSVKGKTATVSVSVPSAGKLVASGKAVSKASAKATGAATIAVKLTLNKHSLAVLAKHRGRKLLAKINLTFTPKKGAKLKTTTTAFIG